MLAVNIVGVDTFAVSLRFLHIHRVSDADEESLEKVGPSKLDCKRAQWMNATKRQLWGERNVVQDSTAGAGIVVLRL